METNNQGLIKEEKVMFTGDFLFYGSIGRTDFPGGSNEKMASSLSKIVKYPADIVIYPGHGKSSMIREEKPIYLELKPRLDY